MTVNVELLKEFARRMDLLVDSGVSPRDAMIQAGEQMGGSCLAATIPEEADGGHCELWKVGEEYMFLWLDRPRDANAEAEIQARLQEKYALQKSMDDLNKQ